MGDFRLLMSRLIAAGLFICVVLVHSGCALPPKYESAKIEENGITKYKYYGHFSKKISDRYYQVESRWADNLHKRKPYDLHEHTNRNLVMKHGMMHASEITLKNGYSYFEVEHVEDHSVIDVYSQERLINHFKFLIRLVEPGEVVPGKHYSAKRILSMNTPETLETSTYIYSPFFEKALLNECDKGNILGEKGEKCDCLVSNVANIFPETTARFFILSGKANKPDKQETINQYVDVVVQYCHNLRSDFDVGKPPGWFLRPVQAAKREKIAEKYRLKKEGKL